MEYKLSIEIRDKLQRGYCYLSFDDGEYIVHSIHVLESYQKHGVGTSLIKSAESIIQNLGGSKSILYVLSDTWQYDWYSRIGYEESNDNDILGFKKMEKLLNK